jgi:hypothetical protein
VKVTNISIFIAVRTSELTNEVMTHIIMSSVHESVKNLLTIDTESLNKLWLGPVTLSKVSDRPCVHQRRSCGM